MDFTILFYIGGFLAFLWLCAQPHDMQNCRHESHASIEARIYNGRYVRYKNNRIISYWFQATNWGNK